MSCYYTIYTACHNTITKLLLPISKKALSSLINHWHTNMDVCPPDLSWERYHKWLFWQENPKPITSFSQNMYICLYKMNTSEENTTASSSISFFQQLQKVHQSVNMREQNCGLDKGSRNIRENILMKQENARRHLQSMYSNFSWIITSDLHEKFIIILHKSTNR